MSSSLASSLHPADLHREHILVLLRDVRHMRQTMVISWSWLLKNPLPCAVFFRGQNLSLFWLAHFWLAQWRTIRSGGLDSINEWIMWRLLLHPEHDLCKPAQQSIRLVLNWEDQYTTAPFKYWCHFNTAGVKEHTRFGWLNLLEANNTITQFVTQSKACQASTNSRFKVKTVKSNTNYSRVVQSQSYVWN